MRACQSCQAPTGPYARFCKSCANERRAAALREHRPIPRPRRGRTIIEKTCPTCSQTFKVTTQTRRQTYCSPSCGSKASQAKRKISLSKEALQETINTVGTYIGVCEKLGIAPWTLYRRMREFGLTREKKALKPRHDGYLNYGSDLNHRRIMEKHVGRKFLPREQVHHIDGDKNNNDPTKNLALVNGPREHQAVHHSLQECGYELYKRGLIGFNRETNRYVLLTALDSA